MQTATCGGKERRTRPFTFYNRQGDLLVQRELMSKGRIDFGEPLSKRELQVVELLALGLKNEAISEQLDISKRTVDKHISRIFIKSGTDNRVSLVLWALKLGKVCLDQFNCCQLSDRPDV